MGSVHYSSPEQARNGFVDGKSDIYSLGIVMYEMVTGRVPFDGDNTVAIAIQHLQEEMVAPSAYAPDLPISLEKIILKATMKKADRRYATISDMLMDLKKALVSPNEDFVTIVESDLGQTRVMHKVTPEQEETLTKRAAEALTFNDDYDDEYYDDEYYDDEYYDDDDYDDEEEDSKMDRILTISGIVAAIAIVTILVVIAGNFVGLFSFGSKKVTMINVVGTQYEEALQQLEDLGLTDKNVVVSYEDNNDVSDGIITEQSVPEGKEFSLSDTLRLTVEGSDGSSDSGKSESKESESSSSSDGTVSVPSVVGMTQADATQTLSNSQIVVTSTTQEFSEDVPTGSVVSQSIEAGEKVTPNTSITLVISKGKEDVTYSYSIPNPYDGECTYEIVELGKTGTIPKNGSINISEVKVDTLTVTLTYTPLYLSGDGSMKPNPNATETSTQTVKGTPN